MLKVDVAIVGAGPTVFLLLRTRGSSPVCRYRVFGEAKSFWRRNMPARMLLRSPWNAAHIADPDGRLKLEAYTGAWEIT